MSEKVLAEDPTYFSVGGVQLGEVVNHSQHVGHPAVSHGNLSKVCVRLAGVTLCPGHAGLPLVLQTQLRSKLVVHGGGLGSGVNQKIKGPSSVDVQRDHN